jgi:hypothetical protein
MPAITIAGKKYTVEIRNGERYIMGLTVNDFIDTLTFNEKLDCAITGQMIVEDIVKGRKVRSPQRIINELHQKKNN